MDSVTRKKRKISISLLAAIGTVLLAFGIVSSISVGAADIKMMTVWNALVSFDQSKEHLIIQTLRMPRALMAVLVGANLAVAGALMQAVTRNPLASPQVFGINAGASLIVVASVVLFPNLSPSVLVYSAFLGAAMGGIIVYSFASAGGMSPVKLALAGMAVHFFLSSMTEGFIIFNEHTTESVLYWLTGAIDGSTWVHVQTIFPWAILGLTLSFVLAKSVTILGLGEDVAKGLGQKAGWVRLITGITVIILAGSAVSVAGPIAFIGLIIPHLVRPLVGEDYRLILPFAALFGALLLVYADILSRFIAYPFESPVGIVTAMIGTPFFLYLARRGRKFTR
jgi:ABC-type Fe3+-siderophore transport system permease subunit